MNYEPRTRRSSALAVAAAVLFASSAFGEEVTATIQKANLWLYVTQASFSGMPMDTVDVTADSAFDINPMELTVGIVAKGKSSNFEFMQPIFADGGPVTSDAHFSPSIPPADVTGASAAVGTFFAKKVSNAPSMRVPRAAVWCSPACSGTNARPRRYAG